MPARNASSSRRRPRPAAAGLRNGHAAGRSNGQASRPGADELDPRDGLSVRAQDSDPPEEAADTPAPHSAERPVVRDPDDISQLLCDRVRELRKSKDWTLEQLSAACGVSRSMLSQIERNQANPTLGVAFRIAQAFGMSLGELVDTPDATPRIDVVRRNDRTFHYRSNDKVHIRTLSPPHLEKDVEFYELTLKPGGALVSEPHFKGVREVLTVEKGCVQITCSTDRATLNHGDSAHYAADVPHSIQNVGKGEAVVVLAEMYR